MTPLGAILRRMAENPRVAPLVRAALAAGIREADERAAVQAAAETALDGIAQAKIEGRNADA